jgi:hypothetical protein
LLLRFAVSRHHLRAADEDAWVDAQSPANETEHHDGADPNAAAATREPIQAAAPVFNSVAGRKFVEAHWIFSRSAMLVFNSQLRQLRQRRQATIRGQFVDDPRQNLRELLGDFLLREA